VRGDDRENLDGKSPEPPSAGCRSLASLTVSCQPEFMSKSIRASRKYVRINRPAERGFNIGVRLQKHQLDLLDRWISKQVIKISRPAAIRELVMLGLADTMLNDDKAAKRKK
jgi:hypothetical protein